MNPEIEEHGVRCGRIGCKEPGKWRPVIVARVKPMGPSLRAMVDLLVCDHHQARLMLDDVLSAEGWKMICSSIRATGKAAPRRELTHLEWELDLEAARAAKATP